MFDLAKARLEGSFSTIPKSIDWLWAFMLLFVFASIVIPFGFQLKFLRLEIPQLSLKAISRVILTALFFPAVTEEAFFRVLFLARTCEQISAINQSLLAIASLILFIVYHPLNAYLFIHNARKTFSSFAFLASAAFLGIICTITYLISGSVYPPIIIHWLIVIFWLLVFGGYQRLN